MEKRKNGKEIVEKLVEKTIQYASGRGKPMKTKGLCLFILMMVIASCSNEDEEPTIIGYVIDKLDNQMLVVSKDPQDFSDDGGIAEYYDAISLSEVPVEVNVGELVKVWVEGPIAESYPMQAKAGKVEIVNIANPDGADMTQSEVIQQAIEEVDRTVAIRNIKFDKEADIWKLELREIIDESVFEVEISDE